MTVKMARKRISSTAPSSFATCPWERMLGRGSSRRMRIFFQPRPLPIEVVAVEAAQGAHRLVDRGVLQPPLVAQRDEEVEDRALAQGLRGPRLAECRASCRIQFR